MSIETLLPLAEPPAAPAASFASHAPDDASSATTPPSSTTQSLQERRLRAARELDHRIRRLEQETVHLATGLDAARRTARDQLAELQQRSTSLTTEVLRVGARLSHQGREEAAQRQALGERIRQRLHELESALQPLGDTLRQQAEQMQELQSRHDTLATLHEHLARIVSRHGRGLDIVAAEFEQRVELLRVSLEGVQALFREQQESQVRMAVEQEAIGAMAQAVQARLDDLRADSLRQHAETRRRVQVLTSLMAALALAGLGLIAWCQLHPVAVAPAALARMTSLDAGLGQQRKHGEQLEKAMAEQARQLQQLEHEIGGLRHDNRRLQAEARRQKARLARMSAEAAGTATAPAAAAASPSAGDARAGIGSPVSSPEGSPLPLPPAVPGLRAGI